MKTDSGYAEARRPLPENYLADVLAAYKKFGLRPPRRHDSSQVKMRLNFLLEELKELADAYGAQLYHHTDEAASMAKFLHPYRRKPRHADALDALVDLAYVLFGTVHLLGFDEVFDEAWRRVHAANMRKERAKTKTKRGTTFDLVKPVGWLAPDLHDLVVRKGGKDGQCKR